MLPEKKKNTNIGVGLGILLEIGGRLLANAGTGLALIGSLITLVGVVLFVWGCMNYAEGKGYSKWLGFLGLLSCIGLIILAVMPDRNKQST